MNVAVAWVDQVDRANIHLIVMTCPTTPEGSSDEQET